MIAKSEKKHLVISGMMRSGTTLLQKSLNTHPDITVDFQSKTDRFLAFKKRYLQSISQEKYHVFHHYNPASDYRFCDFYNWQAQQGDICALLFPEEESAGTHVQGVKEVLVEEFYPGLLDEGVYCLNIFRDPRDVITSMSFGSGSEFAGRPRPVLFDLRNWRKSVHFSFRLAGEKGLKSVRFEDLVSSPEKLLFDIFDWLGVSRFPLEQVRKKISEDQWSGNSSFGKKQPFDSSASGKYASVLPTPTLQFVEAVCGTEMNWLQYEPEIEEADKRLAIGSYQEPFEIDRPEFKSDFSFSDENAAYETERLQFGMRELNRLIFDDTI